MQITRILSLYTHLAQISMLWFSTLPTWMSMYEMFILVLGFTYLSFAGERDCSRCWPLSRGSAPPLAKERKCVEGSSSVLSLFRTSLSLVRGYSDVSSIALSLPRTGLTQILAPRVGGVVRVGRNTERERERRPERSHTVKYTFIMTYWGILIGNTMFFRHEPTQPSVAYSIRVYFCVCK